MALHSSHPLTLTAKHNQACHWLSLYEYELENVRRRNSIDSDAYTSTGSSDDASVTTPEPHRQPTPEVEPIPDNERQMLIVRAEAQLRDVVVLRTEKLGQRHQDTVLSGDCLRK